MEHHFLRAVVDVPEDLADTAGELALAEGVQGIEVRDRDTWVEGAPALPEGRAQIIVWLSPDTDTEAFAARMQAALGGDLHLGFEIVDAEDWVAKVRALVQPVELGRRLRVRPSWHPPLPSAPADQVEIVLDPGLAFGTGSHATTALCLEALEAALDARGREGRAPSLLDVGTGSGILCITAARLGAGACLGLDNDAMAVKVAAENAGLNGVSDRTRFSTQTPGEVGGVWDLVAANIQLGILVELAPQIAPRVAPGGELYLSGLLVEQADEAEETYAGLGLVPAGRETREGWALVRLARPAI